MVLICVNDPSYHYLSEQNNLLQYNSQERYPYHIMNSRRRNTYRHYEDILNIPAKANLILNIILGGLLLIALRVWHLTVVQHEEKVEESRKPQRRVVLEAAKRGTIRDRFNIPLAINKVQYNVAIIYSQIKQIPSVSWSSDSKGKRIKHYKRKEYITALSQLLGKELGMDGERIEDLIHAKATFYNQIPFLIKEDITEQEYYRLKMLEKDWTGIATQRVPRRHYVMGKVAGDILGYMGAINSQEYEKIIQEIKALESYVDASDSGEEVILPETFQSLSLEQVRRRLKDLHELAYSINDSIGKTGIEGRYEKTLRGFRGKKIYYSDAQGNYLRELPGAREPLSGKRLLLTLSSELQKYAEELLIENETIRQTKLCHLDAIKHTILAQKSPWIKGGAIVAMDPNSGEILAMASHPRFDPNDFIASGNGEDRKKKRSNVQKWLENESYLGEMWDQYRLLEKDTLDIKTKELKIESTPLTWDNYLAIILAKDSPLLTPLSKGTVSDAIIVQKNMEALLELSGQHQAYPLFNSLYRAEGHQPQGNKLPAIEQDALIKNLEKNRLEVNNHKKALDTYLSAFNNTYDQVLFIDLMRLVVPAHRFSDELTNAIGNQSLSTYRQVSAAMVKIHEATRKMAKDLFHELHFKDWRKTYGKEYLKQKRIEEKLSNKFAKPYIDYLDQEEEHQFLEFWKHHKWKFIESFLKGNSHQKIFVETEPLAPYYDYFQSWHQEISQGAHQEADWFKAYITLNSSIEKIPSSIVPQYLQSLRSYQELDRPLLGHYRYLRKNNDNTQLEKHLASGFYPKYGYGYGRSQAYRQAASQGSIFKIVTAYEALVQRYHKLIDAGNNSADLNPMKMIDRIYHKGKELYVGYTSNGEMLPRYYKGGRLPRSAMGEIGEIDLLKALETSSNPYFALLAGDILDSPEDLSKAAKLFSFGNRTGVDLPGEIPGNVPEDLLSNRTGLYSFSIGQHTLIVSPLQTSVMLSSIANGGKVLKPKIVGMMVGKEPKRGKELAANSKFFPYEQELSFIGIDFPLFIAADAEQQKSLIQHMPTEIQDEIFLPEAIQKTLLNGMSRVVAKTHNESLKSLSRLYSHAPEAIEDYVELKYQLLGKTSTAESIENIDLDRNEGTNLYTHVWFGGIVYDREVVDKKSHHFLFQDANGKAELVVVVYLRYGGYGKEAAPVAAQVAKKWREIKNKHAQEHKNTGG